MIDIKFKLFLVGICLIIVGIVFIIDTLTDHLTKEEIFIRSILSILLVALGIYLINSNHQAFYKELVTRILIK